MTHSRREKCGCVVDVPSGLLTQACEEHAQDAELLHDARPRGGRGGGSQRRPTSGAAPRQSEGDR